MDQTREGVVTSTLTFAFDYKSFWQHVRSVFARPVSLICTFAALFGAFWTIYEATISSLDLSPARTLPYLAFLGLSSLTALGVRTYQYINEVPNGLENVNKTAQRIAQLRRPRWEFRFAKSVLAERLSPIDNECRDLLDGNEFVPAARPNDIGEYLAWLSDRSENIMRLTSIANRVMIIEFPSALRSTEDAPATPTIILAKIEAIARLYQETVAIERLSHSVIPPTHFERVHSLQIGWSQPIRDAIQELFHFLQRICDVDYRKEFNLDFTIEFDVPHSYQEYCDELAQLETQLPRILDEQR